MTPFYIASAVDKSIHMDISQTLDHAIYLARKQSGPLTFRLLVMDNRDGEPRVRVMAEAGKAYWVVECDRCKGIGRMFGYDCDACKANGYTIGESVI